MKRKNVSKIISGIVDWAFGIMYAVLTIVTILDMFGVSIPFIQKYTSRTTVLLKLLIIVFASVGIVILNDKRELQKSVEKPIEHVETLLDSQVPDIHVFTTKDEFYIFYSTILRNLPSNAEVLVTSFEKNQGVDYYTGENKHIEAFMDDWKSKIKSNNISVKQIVHVFSMKEYEELKERVNEYSNCFNYSASVMVGFPIRPFIDFAVVNKEYVMLHFPNDKNDPYEEAFSLAIKDTKFAGEFAKYFDIYWNNDCCVVKNRDGIRTDNMEKIQKLVFTTTPEVNPFDLNSQTMKVVNICRRYNAFSGIITYLHSLLISDALKYPYDIAEKQVNELAKQIRSLYTSPVDVEQKDVCSVMTTVLQKAEHSIQATSVEIGDNKFWTEEFGEHIFSLNTQGIKNKKINVNRIFIIAEDQRKNLNPIFTKQKNAGVNVSILSTPQGAETFRDFVIIDDVLVLELLNSQKARIYLDANSIKMFGTSFSTYLRQSDTFKK